MRCPSCRGAMENTSRRTIEEEKGIMTISPWRCRPCYETAGEIGLSAGYYRPERTKFDMQLSFLAA